MSFSSSSCCGQGSLSSTPPFPGPASLNAEKLWGHSGYSKSSPPASQCFRGQNQPQITANGSLAAEPRRCGQRGGVEGQGDGDRACQTDGRWGSTWPHLHCDRRANPTPQFPLLFTSCKPQGSDGAQEQGRRGKGASLVEGKSQKRGHTKL